ncbi:MAG: acyl-CoA reductase [Cyclonatronaceae bacterium]
MTSAFLQRARLLGTLVQTFLKDESGRLAEAVDRTVSEGLFCEADVRFALRHAQRSITPHTLESWMQNCIEGDAIATKIPLSSRSELRVLCLHAGNLPLVGLQDIIAVLLSGSRYYGKISRKDPHILSALLDELHASGAFGPLRYSTNLEEFDESAADLLIFSGSGRSVEHVMQRLKTGRMVHEKTSQLLRTAHTSAAYIDPDALTHEDKKALHEALFRYEGKGCRSLNTIFTPDAEKLLAHFKQAKEQEFRQNRYVHEHIFPKTPAPRIHYLKAFNEGINRPYVQIGRFMIQVSEPQPDVEELITLTTLPESKREEGLSSFIENCGTGFQSLYAHQSSLSESSERLPFEPLGDAQCPPVHWTPDGIDPLAWLIKQRKEQAHGRAG